MVQRGGGPGLPLESTPPLGVRGKLGWQDLDGNATVQSCVLRLVDLSRYSQIVFETQRQTKIFFNRSKKGSALCGKVEKENDGEFWKEPELAPEVILTELRTVVGK